MKTIRKNAKNKIQEIARGTFAVKSFTLDNGFIGKPLAVADDLGQALADQINKALASGASLRTDRCGNYTLQYDSNHWLEINSAKIVS